MQIWSSLLWWIFWAAQLLLALYFLMPFFLLIIKWLQDLSGGRLKKKYPVQHAKEFDFAAIITAHQDTRFIPPLVDSFLKQTHARFAVYVVADDCDISNLQFPDPRIVLLKPEKALHAKIKSIKLAIENFIRPHDALVIFDSDNLVHPEYLEKLNKNFQQGFKAVQTHMLSKNTQTVYAKLDSVGFIYHNFTERQIRMDLGLSSCTLGLGIAIEKNLYDDITYRDTLGGFDKKLQADLVKSVPQVAFAEDAIVYDEKVDDGNTLEKQRTRWLFAYFRYFRDNWNVLMKGFRRLNFNLVFFGFNALRPPLFILAGLGCLFVAVDFMVEPVAGWIGLGLLLLFALSFVLIVITQSRQKGMLKAFIYMPIFVLRQARALLKIRKAGKSFLKTEHTRVIYIDELMKNESA